MIPGFLTTATRRRLLAGAASLTLGQRQTGFTPGLESSRPEHLDGRVLVAAEAFMAVERRKLALVEGPHRIPHDDARDDALQPLIAEQETYLRRMCAPRARTLDGHRARAIAYALWDAGELSYRAQTAGFLEDRLLNALVRDLAGASL